MYKACGVKQKTGNCDLLMKLRNIIGQSAVT